MNKKIILSVTAHPDDEALGFGATAAKLTTEGHTVYNCILSGEAAARRHRPEVQELYQHTLKAQEIMGAQAPIIGHFPNMGFNTLAQLDLVKFIENVMEEVKPDIIFTHHPYDLNNDHYHVSKACQAATRLSQRKPAKPIEALYFMEILSSTDWAFPVDANTFQANTFFEVGEHFITKKIEALEAYKGIMRPFPHPRSPEIVKSLAAYRGGQAGVKYAEAFQLAYQLLQF